MSEKKEALKRLESEVKEGVLLYDGLRPEWQAALEALRREVEAEEREAKPEKKIDLETLVRYAAGEAGEACFYDKEFQDIVHRYNLRRAIHRVLRVVAEARGMVPGRFLPVTPNGDAVEIPRHAFLNFIRDLDAACAGE